MKDRDDNDKMAELESMIEEQDAEHEAKMAEHEATIRKLLDAQVVEVNETDADLDADRLLVLDQIAERMPELDLDQQDVDWIVLPDGAGVCSVTRTH